MRAGTGLPDFNLPESVRSQGRIMLQAVRREQKSVIGDIHEEGASRARFPRHASDALGATLVNIGGGIAGGDSFAVECRAEGGATALLTTSAAERVYRSLGAPSRIETRLAAAPRAKLIWMPQELILYDGGRLERTIDIDTTASATICITELIALGRPASGETVTTCDIRDHWRIRRDGKLIFAEALRIDSAMLSRRERPSRLAGMSVFATALLISLGAEELIDTARNLLGQDGETECAVSAFNGMLIVRGRAKNAFELKNRIAALWRGLALFPTPRIWN